MLFRKESLERLATPEKLDRALVVTPPKTWLALVVLLAMVGSVVVWSVVGKVSTYVAASGILLNRGGAIVDAVPSNAGTLTRIIPVVGDLVEEGAIVAETVHQETAERYQSARATVDERARALDDLRARAAAEDALLEGNLAHQRERLQRLERTARRAVERAEGRLQDQRKLFETGVATRVSVEDSQDAFDQAQQNLFDVMRQRDDLELRELQRQQDRNARIAEAEAGLRAAERQAGELEAALQARRVLAPVSGRVIEIKAPVGVALSPGQPVVSIETRGDGLEGLVYVPPVDGKRVEAGMKVLVSPSTARQEESGALLGTVASISEFPMSLDGLVATLQNRDLARSFSEQGPPHASRVSLETDPTTASGFAWSSPKGAEVTLTSGTLISVEIEIANQPPIALVVPLIKEAFGL